MPHFPYIADNLKQAFFQFDLKKKEILSTFLVSNIFSIFLATE